MTPNLALKRRGEVARAQRIFARIAARDPFAHRDLKREAALSNPYVLGKLARRGVVYDAYTGAFSRRPS